MPLYTSAETRRAWRAGRTCGRPCSPQDARSRRRHGAQSVSAVKFERDGELGRIAASANAWLCSAERGRSIA